MQVRISARITVWALLAMYCTSPAWSDALVVRGQRVRTSVAFEFEGEEVWAPLLDGLGYLGAKHEVTNDAIRITTVNGREVLISRKRPEATRDGMLREMPGVPKTVRGRTLLPARAVGSLLGCAVRWEEESRTLYVHPWIRKFSLAQLRDRYRLTVEAEAPITYRIGELGDPPRYFIDLLNTDLAQIPSAFAAEGSYLKSARIHQHSLAPDPEGDVARVVVEMAERRQCRIRESDDKCRLEIDLPLPGAEDLPPDVDPVVLTDIAFERRSPRVAAVKLGVFGGAYCTSVNMYDPLLLGVDIPNATNQLRSPMPLIDDFLVDSVEVGPSPGHPGTERVTIALKQPTGHGIVVDDGEVRILLGRFELAELKVVIDAGHGGHDTGAVGRSGLQEKDVNLDIARRVYRLLKAMGVNVCLTRVGDNPVRPWTRGHREQQKTELLTRCQIANQMEADLFVSVHANARRSNPMEHRGTETYYRQPNSFAFAHAMQRELVRAIGLPDGGVIRHPKSIIVLQYTEMPSVLVEVGYLSHPADETILATEELRERAAMGIANGVRKYVDEGGLLDKLALRERERRYAQPTAGSS
jgi:N-acetylmuramoyl-L-alanine amidase